MRKLANIAFVATTSILLAGCFFKVNSQFHYEYPIQSDGTVDLQLAPEADLQNFRITGFYPSAFGLLDVEVWVYCVGELVIMGPQWLGPFIEVESANAGTVFDIAIDLTSPNIQECVQGDDTLGLALRIGDHYAPILSEDNYECVLNKISAEGKSHLRATAECLAQDPRESEGLLGFDDSLYSPAEINQLWIQLPAG